MLVNIMIDARVDALTSLRRVPAERSALSATPAPSPGRKPPAAAGAIAAGPQLVERSVVEAIFTASPAAVRKVLNQISTSEQQIYVVRTLHVLNEKEKGPSREVAVGGTAGATPAPVGQSAKPSGNAALQFIVGNERLTTSARIEMLRFTF